MGKISSILANVKRWEKEVGKEELRLGSPGLFLVV